jgi:hypothetical protein
MKRSALLAVVMCIAGMLAGSQAIGAVVTYDMDSIAAGTYTGAQFNALFSGVSFSNSAPDGGFEIQQGGSQLGGDFSPTRIVLNAPYITEGNLTTATFATATNFVSVVLGDYNMDADSLYLKAYDGNNQLLGSDFFANPSSSYDGHTLRFSTTSPLIAKVEFYGVGVNNNSVYWDNFSFGNTPAAVPEPSTLLLLGSGLTGLAFGARRRRRD